VSRIVYHANFIYFIQCEKRFKSGKATSADRACAKILSGIWTLKNYLSQSGY